MCNLFGRSAGAKFTIKVMFDLWCNNKGREVGRWTIVEKTLKEMIRDVTIFMQSALMISWERENLFQKGRPFCPWIRRVSVAGPGLEEKQLLVQFASHAGASIFKSLPSVWQQLEGDFHCGVGRGKGSLLFSKYIKLEESFASDHRNAWISTSPRKIWTMWLLVESGRTCGLGKGNSPVARSEQGGSGRKGKNKTKMV